MMKARRRRKRKNNRSKFIWLASAVIAVIAIGTAVYMIGFYNKGDVWISPEEMILTYMAHIPEEEYEEMYGMLDIQTSGNITQEDFIKRNSAIYEGIEVQNIAIEIMEYSKEKLSVRYQTSFETAAGNINFENDAYFLEGEDGYKLVWSDSLIFPELKSSDKVRVSTTQAERGEILDRNGSVLAGKGVASSVGIVPGKLEDRDSAIQEIAELLGIDPETIEKKLSAQWVKDDYFVPIKTIPKVDNIELMSADSDEEVQQEQERQGNLLMIPGIMITDTEVREYPLEEAAAHLVGYVQSVTAEDLEKHAGEGYLLSYKI